MENRIRSFLRWRGDFLELYNQNGVIDLKARCHSTTHTSCRLMWTYRFVLLTITSLALTSAALVLEPRAANFAADPSIDVKEIVKASKSGKRVLATFPTGTGRKVKIFGDWLDLIQGAPVIHFTADMDVDCDGVDVGPVPIPESRG